jgi:hypothetical protein
MQDHRAAEEADVVARTLSAHQLMDGYGCSASGIGHRVTQMLEVLRGRL